MIWYKAWLETRWRFLLCLSGLVMFCVFLVIYRGTGDDFQRLPAWAFSPRNQRIMLYFAHQYLVFWWTIAVVLLAMGGLLRECATGVSSFTLALPISRARILFSRVALGITQAITLAIAPWIAIMLVLHFYLREPIPFDYTCLLVIALVGGGLFIFAIAVFVSSLVEGEYTAPAIAMGVVFLIFFFGNVVEWLQPYSILRLMSLRGYIDRGTFLVQRPFPWLMLMSSLLGAALLLVLSARLIARRDF